MTMKSSQATKNNKETGLKAKTSFRLNILEQIDKNFLNSITDRIFLKDNSGKYIFLNKAVSDFWNITSDEAIGKTASEIFHKQTAKTLSEGDQSVFKTGKPYREEKYVITNDGTEVPVSVTKNPLKDKNGKIIGLIGISRDANKSNQQVKSLQEENRVLKEQLKNLKARLNKERKSNSAAKQFLDMAIKTARSAIFFIDAKTIKIKDCSRSALKIFGESFP